MASSNFVEQLGLELPIIQAPMAGVQDSELAFAVAATGALGSLPCGMLDAASLRDSLQTSSFGDEPAHQPELLLSPCTCP